MTEATWAALVLVAIFLTGTLVSFITFDPDRSEDTDDFEEAEDE